MGVVLERIKHIRLTDINDLFLAIQSAHLQKRQGEVLDGERRSVARAELIRARLARKTPSQN
jgi:protein-arginine kinase